MKKLRIEIMININFERKQFLQINICDWEFNFQQRHKEIYNTSYKIMATIILVVECLWIRLHGWAKTPTLIYFFYLEQKTTF